MPESNISIDNSMSGVDDKKSKVQSLTKHCADFQKADNLKAVFQVLNTLIPFVIIYAIMVMSFNSAYWLSVLLTIPASLLLVRLFIIQHDCGHNSFFTKRKWNNRVGRLLSVLTWTPYDFWRRTHNLHHASSGNLDNRGFGSIETITIDEYKALTPKLQFWYRVYRNPYILLLLGTPFFIIVAQRFAFVTPFPFCKIKQSIEASSIWKSVYGLNLAIVSLFGALGMVIGFDVLFITYIPILIGTSWLGGWMFFIQHQFEDAHWDNQDNWEHQEAALMGSSFYDLHPVLQWFTGNIGLHHIHHLNARIPNYRLQECMDKDDNLKDINHIKLWESLKCAKLALWDEKNRKMITFKQLT